MEPKKRSLLDFQKISAQSKIFFLQNLSIMVKTGMPLADSLKSLAEQTKNRKLKTILNEATEKISAGKTLSESLENYQKDFGELFINMIRAGEASGRLEQVLNQLFLQTKKDHALIQKVRNALTYPTIIVIAMFGIGAFMAVFVLPNITSVFKDLNANLPLPTIILIAISDFMKVYGFYFFGAVIVALITLFRLIKTKAGKKVLDRLLLKTPIVSGIIKKIQLARFARSLSSLLKTDIAIVETLSITSRVLGNTVYQEALADSAEKIKKGEKLAVIFRQHPQIFPAMITQMIGVGEDTGTLDEIMENLASFYEEEVTQTMDTLPTIIEPVLMLLIGAAVAVIAVAILLPMYNLTETI